MSEQCKEIESCILTTEQDVAAKKKGKNKIALLSVHCKR